MTSNGDIDGQRPLLSRAVPVGEAILVAAIWGSSFVGVKTALEHAGPLTIAAVRYLVAGLLLLPWATRAAPAQRPSKGVWRRLVAIGLAQYAVGNGALFVALTLVGPTAASLAISLTPVPVCLLGIAFLREWPNRVHLVGIALAIGGSLLFFSAGLEAVPIAALGLLSLATISFSVMPILGRDIARRRAVSNCALTAYPLVIGGVVLSVVAGVVEGAPRLPLSTWGILLGLALVNTLAAYSLFNHALHRLHATEANVLLNLSPVATALIAWGAFGDRLTTLQIAAMAVVIVGASLAQWRRRTARRTT